jgi:hypothetical protein
VELYGTNTLGGSSLILNWAEHDAEPGEFEATTAGSFGECHRHPAFEADAYVTVTLPGSSASPAARIGPVGFRPTAARHARGRDFAPWDLRSNERNDGPAEDAVPTNPLPPEEAWHLPGAYMKVLSACTLSAAVGAGECVCAGAVGGEFGPNRCCLAHTTIRVTSGRYLAMAETELEEFQRKPPFRRTSAIPQAAGQRVRFLIFVHALKNSRRRRWKCRLRVRRWAR